MVVEGDSQSDMGLAVMLTESTESMKLIYSTFVLKIRVLPNRDVTNIWCIFKFHAFLLSQF